MEQQERKVGGFLGGVAATLNFVGSIAVKTYDAASAIVGNAGGFVGKTAGTVGGGAGKGVSAVVTAPVRLFDMVCGGIGKALGKDETVSLRKKVGEYEEKIRKLYFEIGKEGATAAKLESEKITELIGRVREYEQEIQRLHAQISEMAEQEALKKEEKKTPEQPKKKVKVTEEQASKDVRAAIEKAVQHGDFHSQSEKSIFLKIANDLLDDEMEIKTLAAAELGKMGIRPAVEVLLAAVKYDNPYLSAEIVNSLTNIGDGRTLTICKEMAKGPNYRLRISCLRGLYKMGSDDEIAPFLTDALTDEHPEVRRMAVTFLGWKDIADSIPGLIQTLTDKDETVRKAAVTALGNIKDESSVLPLMRSLGDESPEIRRKALEALSAITGEEIVFNIESKGRELNDGIEKLKQWWQDKRISKIDESLIPAFVPSAPDIQDDEPSAGVSVEAAETPSAVPEAAGEILSEPVQPEAAPDARDDAEVITAEIVEEAPPSVQEVSADAPPPSTEFIGEIVPEGEPVQPVTETPEVSSDIYTIETAPEETVQASAEVAPEAPSEVQAGYSGAGDEEIREDVLKRKLKSELIALCRSRGKECDETFTKAELIDLLIKE